MKSRINSVPAAVYEEAFSKKQSLKNSMSSIDKLAKSIKNQFQKDNIDLFTYEEQINTLTCVRLFLELYGEELFPVPVVKGVHINAYA